MNLHNLTLDTYSEAKKKVSLFCYTSTTSEIDTENKKRKRFKKKNFESSSNHEDNEKYIINSKKNVFENNLFDNLLDAPRPTGTYLIYICVNIILCFLILIKFIFHCCSWF